MYLITYCVQVPYVPVGFHLFYLHNMYLQSLKCNLP